MKFTVKVGDLKEALNIVSTTVDKRDSSETNKIYVESKKSDGVQRVIIFSTDSIGRTLMRINATVEEEGSWLLSPRNALAMITGFGDDELISFTANKSKSAGHLAQIEVKVGKAKSKITGSTALDTMKLFLTMMPITKKETAIIPLKVLSDLFGQTGSFVMRQGQVEDRQGFRNLQLTISSEGYTALSTNTQVIARAQYKTNLENQKDKVFLIPVKALPELIKILSRSKLDKETEVVKLIYNNGEGESPTQLYFRFKDVVYGTSLGPARFPDIANVMDKLQKGAEVMVDRKKLADNLVRCKSFCDSPYVNLRLENGQVFVKTSGLSGDIEEEIDTTLITEEDKTKIGSIDIDIGFLGDVLSSSKEEWVKFAFGTGKPVAIMEAGAGEPNLASYVIAGAQ
jgi:DNA polymerase III sliding clamp (beta) subunit (PCNA family)